VRVRTRFRWHTCTFRRRIDSSGIELVYYLLLERAADDAVTSGVGAIDAGEAVGARDCSSQQKSRPSKNRNRKRYNAHTYRIVNMIQKYA